MRVRAFTVLVLVLAASLTASGRAAAETGSHLWLLGGVGLGGGSERMGPVAAALTFSADVWPTSVVGVGLGAGVLGTGEPDGRGGAHRYVAPHLDGRVTLASSERSRAFLFGSLGSGWIGLRGYDRHEGRDRYDEGAFVATARAGLLAEVGVLGVGGGLDALVVPGEGTGVVAAFRIGLTL